MKKYVGKVLEMNLRDTIEENYGNKIVTLNVYSILIEGENDYLITKRDVNIKTSILGKHISYYKTQSGLIYKSKIVSEKFIEHLNKRNENITNFRNTKEQKSKGINAKQSGKKRANSFKVDRNSNGASKRVKSNWSKQRRSC